jgi:hypothetical protein
MRKLQASTEKQKKTKTKYIYINLGEVNNQKQR